ncbi:GWxTD domain-containing protein [candidate division KSB1 bacterium]|nr:GWxTD domain-containing protein [candidate division KSB1 bacterium]
MFFRKILILSIILISSLSAQEQQADKFNFSFDYATFRGHEDLVYVELYFSVLRNELQYVEDNDAFKAEFVIDAELFRNDSMVINKSWGGINHEDSLTNVQGNQKLLSVNYLQAKPGEYRLVVRLTDKNSGKQSEKEGVINIEAFDEENLCLSEIEFASSIKPSSEKNQYYKNGYSVIPNTERFFGTGLPILMFYTEIYNFTQTGQEDTSKYSIKYSILNGDQEVIREFPARIKKKPGESAVEVGGLNIITFTSGTYFLKIDVIDSTNKALASQQAKFFIYRPGDFAKIQQNDSLTQMQIAERSLQLLNSIYQSASEEELDQEFDATTYIATKEEKEIYKTLDLQGKREFMPQFWARRDRTPGTARNEFREDYLARVRMADREFRGFKKGWKSDEGRVLLIYGSPDEIERFPSSNDNRAYRVWRYFAIQGGVDFIFVDKRGWGEYELVHSTARGELYDVDWQRWLSPN